MAAKDTSTFLTEVNNYDYIRYFLREMYLYGNKSVKDFMNEDKLNSMFLDNNENSRTKKTGISDKSIRDYLKRLGNFFDYEDTDEVNLLSHNHPERKQDKKLFSLRHVSVSGTNYLAFSFRQHAITPADIIFYVYLLELMKIVYKNDDMSLSYRGEDEKQTPEWRRFKNLKLGLTADEIYDCSRVLYEYNAKYMMDNSNSDAGISDDFPLSIDQVKYKGTRLERLSELGILKKTEADGEIYYKLHDDLFTEDNLGDDELGIEKLETLIDFFSVIYPFTVPGVFLRDKVREINDSLGMAHNDLDIVKKQAPSTLFVANENPAITIIDDDIIWSLLKAIHGKDVVVFEYYSEKGKKFITFLPIKVIHELTYGRQYIFGWQYSSSDYDESGAAAETFSGTKGEYKCLRVDRIYSVKLSEKLSRETKNIYRALFNSQMEQSDPESKLDDLYENCYQENFKNAWNVALAKENDCKALIHFEFDRDDTYGPDYLMKSKREGIVKKDEWVQNKFMFEAEVTDASELIPWINSFGYAALVDENTSENLYKQIKKSTEDTLKLYEPLQ